MNMKKRVMMVGSAEQSAGGVASVIRLMKKMPFWEERRCYWLGTQIQRNYTGRSILLIYPNGYSIDSDMTELPPTI